MKHFFYKAKVNILEIKDSLTADQQVEIVKKEFSKVL